MCKMKSHKYILFALVFFPLLLGGLEARCPEVVEGFTLFDLSGSPAKVSCSTHKVLIINFWASWCVPCRVEIPQLIELYQEFKSRGVEVIGVSLDSMRPQSLRPFVRSLNITYPVYLGRAEDLLSRMAVMAIPSTLVIDSKGKVYRKLVGYHSKDEMLAVIRELLKKEQGKS
jgi:thiol-disulfide isomerase/thioredoxin